MLALAVAAADMAMAIAMDMGTGMVTTVLAMVATTVFPAIPTTKMTIADFPMSS